MAKSEILIVISTQHCNALVGKCAWQKKAIIQLNPNFPSGKVRVIVGQPQTVESSNLSF